MELTDNKVKLKVADGMVFREHTGMPPHLLIWFENLHKLKPIVDLDSQQKTYFEKDTLEGPNTWCVCVCVFGKLCCEGGNYVSCQPSMEYKNLSFLCVCVGVYDIPCSGTS